MCTQSTQNFRHFFLFSVKCQKPFHIYTEPRIQIFVPVKRRKADWIGHFLRRNSLLKHTVKGNIGERVKVTRRQG
jgi:hypothetical protein